jgi:hypothetical protein
MDGFFANISDGVMKDIRGYHVSLVDESSTMDKVDRRATNLTAGMRDTHLHRYIECQPNPKLHPDIHLRSTPQLRPTQASQRSEQSTAAQRTANLGFCCCPSL